MIDDKIFSRVCTETLEILANISDEEYDKIPPEFIKMLDKNSDKTYVFDINKEQNFSKQELLDETYDMLAYIYRKYWCDENDKQEFKNKILNNELENKIKIKTVDANEIKQEISNSNQLTILEKNNIFNKIKNILKQILKKK